ncbi:MAG: glycosyltransferase family 4 protein [Gemmatimonadota bacterium]|nr:glycosyltransferase family 4 protein [Gemmatimonadota bacterium]
MSRRLLFVVNDAGFFVSHRILVALAARDAGFDVHVAVPFASPRLREIVDAGLPIHDVPLDRSGMNPVVEGRTLRALWVLYKKLAPDIVHHVTIKPVIYGSLIARRAKVPVVVNAVPGLGYTFLSTGWLAAARRRALVTAYRYAFSSPAVRGIFQNVDDIRAFVAARIIDVRQAVLIPGSGVDLSEFRLAPLPGGTPIVLLPARMLWHKGVGEFVEAARILRARKIDARFVLVGGTDSNRASVPDRQLIAWQTEGAIEWWGPQKNMPSILAQATIVCLPSYREGVPKALLEAAAVGRPIVTTDAPGCRAAVTHGDNGLLVPVADAAALSNAIADLISDSVTRAKMACRSRERAVAEFDVSRVIKSTLGLYAERLRQAEPHSFSGAAEASLANGV